MAGIEGAATSKNYYMAFDNFGIDTNTETKENISKPVDSTNNTNRGIDLSDVNITLFRIAMTPGGPAYTLVIDGNGTVTYNDVSSVKRLNEQDGEQKSKIAIEKVEELVNEFNKADYFNLKDKYEGKGLPIVTTSITIGSKYKSVIDYHGSINLPPELKKLRILEDKIDEFANSSQWVSSAEIQSLH